MPIFHKHGRNILFIHVPKCGGTTVERLFQDNGWEAHYLDGTVGKGTPGYVRWCTPQHMHAEMLRTFFRMDRFDAVFAIVRDPIARLRSEYLWRKRSAPSVPVDGESVEKWAEETFRKYKRNRFIHDNHIRPQSEFVVPEATVYRLENGLDEALADFSARHDLHLPASAPRFRTAEDQGGHRSSDVEITPRLEKRLKSFYRSDYRAFGY